MFAPFDIPWWLALAILAGLLIGLVVGVIATYISVKGLYLLLMSRTTTTIRVHAAVLGFTVTTALLLVIMATGFRTSLEMVTFVLSVPFGVFAGQLVYVLIGTESLPGWVIRGLFPLFTIVNVFLNYTGYIVVVDYLKKRFGTKLS